MALITYLLSAVITLIILAVLYYELWFLRKPKRLIPTGNRIISPANGRIAKIVELNGQKINLRKGIMGKVKSLTNDAVKKGWLIVIVMNIMNVHYQRSPFDGKVLSTRYRKGKLYNAVFGAKNMKATLENEKNEVLIETKYGRMKVVQVAGLVANRIECFVKKNQNIKKGEIIGVIKFGSQVCLVIPKNLDLKAEEGQHVIDGETIIAEKRGK